MKFFTLSIFPLEKKTEPTPQGRVVERGTHTELLTLGGLYASLYYTQFKNEAMEKEKEKEREREGEEKEEGEEKGE